MFNSFHLEAVEAFKRHQYQAAKTLFLQAIDKNPVQPESYLWLGKSYVFCDEKSEALAYLKKYIELNERNRDEVANVSYALDLLGQCYEAIDNDIAAITCYANATRIYPSAASAWHNHGLLHIKLAQNCLETKPDHSFTLFKSAEVFLKKALAIAETNPMFLNSLASCYETYVEALETARGEEAAVWDSIDSSFTLAIDYYRKALAACHAEDAALKNIVISNLSECLAQYGHHCYKTANFARALEFYKQALELDPAHLIVINQIGMSLFKQTLYPEARQYFSDIHGKTEDPQELADAWLNVACCYRLEKSWDNAENALNKARQYAPEDPSIQDESQKLMDSRSKASLVAATQSIFANTDIVSQSEASAPPETSQSQLF